jgi:hypothetical protein
MENETSDAKVPIVERHKEIDLIQSCIIDLVRACMENFVSKQDIN